MIKIPKRITDPPKNWIITIKNNVFLLKYTYKNNKIIKKYIKLYK